MARGPGRTRDAAGATAAQTQVGLGPLIAALLLFGLLATGVLLISLGLHDGKLIYALDDSYVHLAMAKHIAQNGVWGVTRYGFSSSSSSPLWTLLLGLIFKIVGPAEVVPLLLNLICAVLVIVLLFRILTSSAPPGWRPLWTFLVLAAAIVFTPLVPLVMLGQEHTLHVLLTLLFAQVAVRCLVERPAGGMWARDTRWLWVLTPLLMLTRYESIFLVLPVALLFAVRRRWVEGLLLAGLALLPVIAFGILTAASGGFFIPNPILLKANLPGRGLAKTIQLLTGYTAVRRLFINAHLLLPLLAALLLCARRSLAGERGRLLLTIFAIATVTHVSAADVGWFYRYEAYLVALGVLALSTAAAAGLAAHPDASAGWHRRPGRLAVIALGLLFLVALGDRGVRALLETPRATANIYEQQYQTGRFLKTYYEGVPVAVNDIGAVNFLADIRCLDLMGLCSNEVAALMLSDRYSARTRDQLLSSRGIRIAIVYDSWFRIPPQWKRAGQWTIRHNVVNGGDTISFYALNDADFGPLLANLREFAPRLPRTVQQQGP